MIQTLKLVGMINGGQLQSTGIDQTYYRTGTALKNLQIISIALRKFL
jgi:hypothetical protein